MEVRRGGVARASDFADLIPEGDALAFSDVVFTVVRVDRDEIAGVADDDQIAVAAELIAINYLAALDDADRRAFGGDDVDAVVKALPAAAVAGRDGARDRPHERPAAARPPAARRARPEADRRRGAALDRQVDRRPRGEKFLPRAPLVGGRGG